MAEPTVEVILLLLDAEGLTIADLEQARHGTPTTVAADLDEALAAMTPSTRERYAPFLRVLCDGLPEVCWCLCERCSGYVTSTCPCRKTAAAGRTPKSPSWSSRPTGPSEKESTGAAAVGPGFGESETCHWRQ